MPEKVFNAVVDTHVLIFKKDSVNANCVFEVEELKCNVFRKLHDLNMDAIPKDGDPINIIFDSKKHTLFQSIKDKSIPLKSITTVYNGVKPFEKGKGKPPQTDKTMKEKPFVKEGEKPGAEWSPLLRGSLINRYVNLWNHDYWILYGEWLAAPRDPIIFSSPNKIMIRQTGDSLIGSIVEQNYIARNNLHIIILPENSGYEDNYLLALINSKLLNFYYSILNPEKGEALAEVKKAHVEQLPIIPMDFSNSEDKQKHDTLVTLVDQMLSAQKECRSAKSDSDKKLYEQKISMLDKKIDDLVYKLYGLTAEEIKIVEGN